MSSGRLHTAACGLFGVRYPIVQTGMGWVSGPQLTAATSNAGGLGILAGATLTTAELDAAIGAVAERTDAPFGVNLRPDHPDFDRRTDLLIRHGVGVASFAGPPSRDAIDRLKSASILTVPTVGAARHAEKMAEAGVDAVIAQGHEGGGHTGPVPTTLLLPRVCDVVDIPVLAAGGFFDGRGLVAALAYGASGVAMGTRFLLTRECTVPDAVKARYVEARVTDTVVTRAIDGVPQRVVRTSFVDRLERSGPVSMLLGAIRHALALKAHTGNSLGDLWREGRAMRARRGLTWGQLAMAANAPMLTRAAMVDGHMEAGILPTGQVVGVIGALPPVAEVIETIMSEAARTIFAMTAVDPDGASHVALPRGRLGDREEGRG